MKFSRAIYIKISQGNNLAAFISNISNIFFSAAGSHPGAGLPGVLSSAKVVENILKKRYGVK